MRLDSNQSVGAKPSSQFMKRNKPVCRFIPQREANARQTLAQSEATEMVDSRFQSPDALFKIMAAVRTLKFDNVSIDIWHRASFVLSLTPVRPPPERS